MVLRLEIENSYLLQREAVRKKRVFTSRVYLGKAKLFTGSQVEVISGIRRCGKSTLMRMIMKRYGTNIAYFNFEDPRVYGFEVGDFQKLDDIIGRHKKAYFFDEIQNVPSWELYIRQLHDRGEKVFITGSNASLLSKELGTRLTGRHIRHELFPFTYQEFLAHKKLSNKASSFQSYLQNGGFPEFLAGENQEVLQILFKDIVLRDIAVRYGIKNTKTLMDITLFLLSNIGKECSYNSLKKTFAVGSANSVSDYLTWLEDAYLLFFLPRFSWSAKNTAVNPRKVYAIDNGLIKANTLSFSKDTGRMLENLVYMHLRQYYAQLYYYRENSECDFVVFDKNKCKMLIQVCEEINGDTKERELRGLFEAMDFFKLKDGYIITTSQKDTLKLEGKTIHLVPANEFVMEGKA